MIIKNKPLLSPIMVSTISLILLLDLFIVAWLSIFFVASELFPDPSVRLFLAELWQGKMDMTVAFIGIGVAITLYLNLKQAFNAILWVPIIMTISVIMSGFTAGIVTQTARVENNNPDFQFVIIPVLLVSIALMVFSVRLSKKHQI